jgi:hypothetical protein
MLLIIKFTLNWFTLGLEAYKDFANIVKHPEFNPKDVPLSLSTVKKYRDGLPLLPFKGHTVTINNRNAPSTSNPTRQALIFPLKNILHRVLSNPQLREHMYFGPGIYCENKHEIWHGDHWHKSPFFGDVNVKLNNGKCCIFFLIKFLNKIINYIFFFNLYITYNIII